MAPPTWTSSTASSAAPRPRRTEAIIRAGAAVQPGEWTTYGEISVAVFGHRAGARGVGQVAARDDRFLNAHRVIRQGGRIPEGWGGGGDGPVRCRLRLEAEGVRFQTGVADPGCLVHWMTIVDRIASRSPETAPPVTPPAVK